MNNIFEEKKESNCFLIAFPKINNLASSAHATGKRASPAPKLAITTKRRTQGRITRMEGGKGGVCRSV